MEEGFRWTFTTPEAVEEAQGQRTAVPYSVGHLLSPGTDYLPFVTQASDVMHIDLNSCFASIEQQCNALLRGKPVAVAAYDSPRGCIVSPSVEAKQFGVKTGMRVMDGRRLCPDLVVLPSDPWKYRWVNQQLHRLFLSYTPHMEMKSIDEAVLHFADVAGVRGVMGLDSTQVQRGVGCQQETDLLWVAEDIKRRIREEIGDWLRVSVGIGPNRWLAKVAAGLHKPDGLEEINWWNIEQVLTGMKLEDLHGISHGNAGRLRRFGILMPLQMYQASITELRRAFRSIVGLHWHVRLHGYEIEDKPLPRKSFSHMYSLPKPARTIDELGAVMSKLVDSLGFRLRRSGFWTRGLYVGLGYGPGYQDGWHHHQLLDRLLYDSADMYNEVMRMAALQPAAIMSLKGLVIPPVRKVFVGCFALERSSQVQTSWLGDELKKRRLVAAVDQIKSDWGKHALVPARMVTIHRRGLVPDFVAFGGVRELEGLDYEEEVRVEKEEVMWLEE